MTIAFFHKRKKEERWAPGRFFGKLPVLRLQLLHNAQMSVLMISCGPHLPLAFQFVCGPVGGGAANKLEGKWKVSLCLVAPPQAAAGSVAILAQEFFL